MATEEDIRRLARRCAAQACEVAPAPEWWTEQDTLGVLAPGDLSALYELVGTQPTVEQYRLFTGEWHDWYWCHQETSRIHERSWSIASRLQDEGAPGSTDRTYGGLLITFGRTADGKQTICWSAESHDLLTVERELVHLADTISGSHGTHWPEERDPDRYLVAVNPAYRGDWWGEAYDQVNGEENLFSGAMAELMDDDEWKCSAAEFASFMAFARSLPDWQNDSGKPLCAYRLGSNLLIEDEKDETNEHPNQND